MSPRNAALLAGMKAGSSRGTKPPPRPCGLRGALVGVGVAVADGPPTGGGMGAVAGVDVSTGAVVGVSVASRGVQAVRSPTPAGTVGSQRNRMGGILSQWSERASNS